jgi:hypothetical protein
MKNQWQQSTNNFFIREVSQNVETLKPLVYKLEIDERTGELYLSQILDKFDFSYKVYGIETDFINRVEKTYNNTTSNLLNHPYFLSTSICVEDLYNQSIEPPLFQPEHIGQLIETAKIVEEYNGSQDIFKDF